MKILFYTVAIGEACRELQKRAHPESVFVLTEDTLGMDGSAFSFQWQHNKEVYAARTRLPEFVDLDDYDAIVHVEADVTFDPDVEIPLNAITVEPGEKDFRDYCSDPKTKELYACYDSVPDGPATWQGFISIPAKFAKEFFAHWKKCYEIETPLEELITYEALKPFPWRFRNDTAFYPETAAITHHRSYTGKNKLYPQYSIKMSDNLIAIADTQAGVSGVADPSWPNAGGHYRVKEADFSTFPNYAT